MTCPRPVQFERRCIDGLDLPAKLNGEANRLDGAIRAALRRSSGRCWRRLLAWRHSLAWRRSAYSPAMQEAFSTRRRDILSYMAEKGWDYGTASTQAATLHTRKRKDEPERGELSAMAEDAALGTDTREALSASLEELARGLAFDREASELHRDWQEHLVRSRAGHTNPFHAPGSEALADRIAALKERVAQPLEMPGLLGMGLDSHRAIAEERSRIGECRDELARLAKRPNPGSEEWLAPPGAERARSQRSSALGQL